MQRSGWIAAILFLLQAPCASGFTVTVPTASVLRTLVCVSETVHSNCQLVPGLAVLDPPSDSDDASSSNTAGGSSGASEIHGSLSFGSDSLQFTTSATASAVAASEAVVSASASYAPSGVGVGIVLDPGEALAIEASGMGDGTWQLVLTLASTSIECGTTLGACPTLLEGSDVAATPVSIAFEYELEAFASLGGSQSRAGGASVLFTVVPEPAAALLVAMVLVASVGRARRRR